MNNIERRATKGIEVRAADGLAPQLVGYAALFDSRSHDLGGFIEVIKPGAFTRSLKKLPDVVALAHHDPSRPLARRSAGTLKIEEDKIGLRVEITLGETTVARDILADVRSGNIEGMSFGFSTRKDNVIRGKDEVIRELIEVDLHEVSPVTFPAYPETSIAARSVEQALKSQPLQENDPAVLTRLAEQRIRLITFHPV